MLVSLTRGACLWPAAMISWGPGYASAEHRHHAVQLVMTTQGTLRIRGGSERKWIECCAALVRADAPTRSRRPRSRGVDRIRGPGEPAGRGADEANYRRHLRGRESRTDMLAS